MSPSWRAAQTRVHQHTQQLWPPATLAHRTWPSAYAQALWPRPLQMATVPCQVVQEEHSALLHVWLLCMCVYRWMEAGAWMLDRSLLASAGSVTASAAAPSDRPVGVVAGPGDPIDAADAERAEAFILAAVCCSLLVLCFVQLSHAADVCASMTLTRAELLPTG